MELVSEVGVSLIGTSASDDMVAMAAWVSHDADSEERLNDQGRVEKLIDFLYRNRHMSPFEHGHFTFKVDVPIFVAREFMRHRTASYNEVSGRYTEMKPRFWIGDVARVQRGKPGDYYFEDGTDDQTAIYIQSKRKAAKKAWKEYTARLGAGIAKEQAREDLPLSLMTQFYVTFNPRNLMQFLTLRNDKHALKEIRAVAVKMEEIFADTMPLTYRAYAAERERQRNPVITDVELIDQLKEAKNVNRMLKAENEALGSQILALQEQIAKLNKRVPFNNGAYNIDVSIKEAVANPEELARRVMETIQAYQNRRRR